MFNQRSYEVRSQRFYEVFSHFHLSEALTKPSKRNNCTSLLHPHRSSSRKAKATKQSRKRNKKQSRFDHQADGPPDREHRNSRRNSYGMQDESGRAGDLREPERPALQTVGGSKDRDRGGMDVGSGDKCPLTDPAGKGLSSGWLRVG